MNKHRFFSSMLFARMSYKTIRLKTDLDIKTPLENESWKGLNWNFSKDAHQKSEGVSCVRLRKTRLLPLGKIEKPLYPQLYVNRACEA